MRNAFHDDLEKITDQLVEMTRLAGSAVARATTALLDADIHLAESVIAADDELDALSIDLLSRQQPVATDLRVVVTSMRMSSDLERMGDLARHIAKVARLRYPASAVPPALVAHILQMGQVAERIVAKAGSVIASKDTGAALSLEREDDAMDELHRQLFETILRDSGEGAPDVPRETLVDLTLLGRYYERFADHAVSVAQRVVYLVTGEYRSELDLPELDHEEQEDSRVAL